jgi:site-specific DNA recombinase
MARRNNRAHDYLLRGLVSCGHCRYGCVGRCQQGTYDYYVCRTTTRLRATGVRCPARFIPATALDDLVWRDLCQLLETPEMIAQAMERARGGHWLPQERQARQTNLMRGRAALEQQIERLTEAYLAGIVSLEEYKRRRRDAEARLAALARQEQDLTAEIERQSTTASLAAHADAFCQRVRCGLAEADFERRRALVELLIDRVIVTDSEVEIRYVFPTSSKGERERFCRLRMDYQTRLLNGDDRKHLSGASARFLLQLRKPRQQAGHVAAPHAVLGHRLPGPGRQGRNQPHRTTETVCSRGEGGSPSP